MALITFSYEVGARAAEITQGFSDYHGYQATIDGEPNPETRGQFSKRIIGQFIKDSIRAYRANQQAEAARQTSISDTETNITLT